MSTFKDLLESAPNEEFSIRDNIFELNEEFCYVAAGATSIRHLLEGRIFPKPIKNCDKLKNHRPDGFILYEQNGKREVIVLIELKDPKKFPKSPEQALKKIHDWYFPLAESFNCRIVCISDGYNSYLFSRSKKHITKDKQGNLIHFNLYLKELTSRNLSPKKLNEIVNRLKDFIEIDSEGNYQMIVEKIKPFNALTLAREIWQIIWIETGQSPIKCLYNIVEIFIFKFLSELGLLSEQLSFDSLIKEFDCSKNSNQVLSRYVRLIRKEIRTLFPEGKDGTTIINGTIFVNEKGEPNLMYSPLFVNVLKKFNKWEGIDRIDKQFKIRLYEYFLKGNIGLKQMGQYFTPRNVIAGMISMIDASCVSDNVSFCDPFCGPGGFLLEFLNQFSDKLLKQLEPTEEDEINPKFELLGYDKGTEELEDHRTIILAKANMLIYLSEMFKKHKSNKFIERISSIINNFFYLNKTILGTLGLNSKNKFDFIFTNPPYVVKGVSSLKREIDKNKRLRSIYKYYGQGLESLCVEWILNSLKPGGRAFVILPEGLLRKDQCKELRKRILELCTLDAIISLPSNTFYSTPQKTYIVSFTKKFKKSDESYNIFSYVVEEIGETRDKRRLIIDENDMLKFPPLFRQFMVDKCGFKSDNSRCRILNSSSLINDDWTLDKYFTKKINSITENDFYKYVRSFCEEVISMIPNVSEE